MNKWFSWVVFAPEISKLEDIIQTAVRELEKQKENNRIEKFYFLQYTQDVHVTFGIKLPEERTSEVFEEVKLPLQKALNRDFTEKERLNKDGVSLIASLACFSHFLLNASSALGAIRIIDNKLRIDKNWLDNESDKLIKLKGDNKKLFDKIEGYLREMIGVNIEFIEIIKNTKGKGERR